MTFIFTVKGMNCGHCTQAITKAITELDPQARVDTDIPKQTVAVTSSLDREQLSETIVDAGYDIVCAVGGDGSVHEVGTALIGTKTKLAILPVGSGNGLARHMKIPLNVKEAIECINKNNSIQMDTVLVNDKTFLGVGGYGFDALIAKKFEGSRKRGFTSYIKLVLKEVFKYNPINVSIDANGQVRKLPVFLCTIANTSEFGNGFIVSPKSDATDGKDRKSVV